MSRSLPVVSLTSILLLGWTASVAADALDDALDDRDRPSFDTFVAADVAHFSYREFDLDGRELNREDGLLPGIRISTRTRGGDMLARFDASLHSGTVDHDGETQSGRDIDTDTDSTHVSLGLEFGRWLGQPPNRWGGFVRLARRYWDREIQPTGSVQGLSERYRWSEVGLGVRHVWPGQGDSRWQHALSFTAFRVVDGEMLVRLSRISGRRWDDTTLELGRESGLRIRYSATRPLGQGRVLRVEPYLAYWEFGRSNTRPITSEGASTGFTVTEPRSESSRVGVVIGLVF